MSAPRYFGNSPVEITKDEKKYWRIKTTLPGTEPAHSCGEQTLDVPQDHYTQHYRGDGCGNPAKRRYRYERRGTPAACEHGELESVAEHLGDAASQLEHGAEQLSAGAKKLEDACDDDARATAKRNKK